MMFWCIFFFPDILLLGMLKMFFGNSHAEGFVYVLNFRLCLGWSSKKTKIKHVTNHWGIITKNQTRIGHGFAFLISWWSISYSYRCNCPAFFELPKAVSLDDHSQEPEAEVRPPKTLGLWTNRKINQQTCDLLTIVVAIHWQYITIITIHY